MIASKRITLTIQQLLLVFLLLIISACNFKPIYSANNHTYKELSNIEIESVSSHVEGADYYNHLANLLPPEKNSKYLLSTSISFANNFSVIQQNSDILRETSTITVNYTLTKKDTGRVIESDNFSRMASFSTSFSPYSNSVKQQDEQKNLAIMAAEEVRNRIMLAIENKKQ